MNVTFGPSAEDGLLVRFDPEMPLSDHSRLVSKAGIPVVPVTVKLQTPGL